MSDPTISVVIVSRERPESLIWCLSGLDGLLYPAFEVVVVACPAGCSAAEGAGYAERVKLIRYDEANIAAARNLGIAAAAGEIVAFIDDDAVPEPTWLEHLAAPFGDGSVAAVGGFVRGRNGISFQWKAREVDDCGRATPIEVDESRVSQPQPAPGRAIKTEGTNMAVRRDVLAALGGFDTGFRFFWMRQI
ncbi:glycosyltransferase family 2 protein [Rhodobacteraceae bacterium D3-12]|nr:glycosyltransferase family 2 protein [Rhodobacteraceae bacterium D3-12]